MAVGSARRRTQRRRTDSLPPSNVRAGVGGATPAEEGRVAGDQDEVDVAGSSTTGSSGGAAATATRLGDEIDYRALAAICRLRLAPDKSNAAAWCRHVERLVARVSETRSDHACRIHAVASHILHTRTVPDSVLHLVMLRYDYYAPLVAVGDTAAAAAAAAHAPAPIEPFPASRRLERGERLSRAEMAHVFRTRTITQIFEWLGLDDATLLYRCPACTKWKGDVDEQRGVRQTRGLDEAATVHLRCRACNHKWK